MFHSLRWRLVSTFALVILLTLVLSILLAYWTMTRRFDVLVTEESREQALDMAPLLEEIHEQWGDWRDLDALLNTEEVVVIDLLEAPWISDIDWWELTAVTLGLEVEQLDDLYSELGSVEAVATKQGVPPDYLVEAILEQEEAALRESGMFTEREIQLNLAQTEQDALLFIFEVSEDGYDPIALDSELVLTDEGTDWIFDTLLLGEQRLLVTDSDGVVVYDSTSASKGERLPHSTLAEGAQLQDSDGDLIGWAVIAAGPDYYDARQNAFLRNMAWALAISGLIVGLVGLLIGWGIARRVTAPVAQLTHAATRMSEGDSTARVPVHSDDELGRMGDAFNAMADGLESQRDLRNRLVDDIAHELKTPLSVIQLELSAMQDGMQSPETAVGNIQEELDMLDNLVNDVALLSEADEGDFRLDLEPADLGELSSRAVDRWRPLAEVTGVELVLEPAGRLPEVRVDSLRITQVLSNLMANALRHTPRGGRVKIQLEEAAAAEPNMEEGSISYIWTTVSDTGEGISPEDLPHIYDRFYRADRSRSRRTGGRGLGLAIARRIIEGHNGRVWAESKEGEGSTFGYSLPIQPSA